MRIRWTQPAARDLTNISGYIEGHNSAETARQVALTIYRSVSSYPARRTGLAVEI